MIFINNKYTVIYYKIIDRAKTREISGYTEKHHIVPRSLGGTNAHDNLVKLTPKEHFICHLLLIKMVNGIARKKMSYAVWLMCNVKNDSQIHRYLPKSSTYAYIRLTHVQQVSESQKGKPKLYPNPFAGKKHTEQTLQVQRELKLGNKNPNFGVVQKPEWNEKKSKAQKGIKKPLITCEKCGTTVGGQGNYKRWHGPKCNK